MDKVFDEPPAWGAEFADAGLCITTSAYARECRAGAFPHGLSAMIDRGGIAYRFPAVGGGDSGFDDAGWGGMTGWRRGFR